MTNNDPVTRRYLNENYAEANPGWDSNDSPWKAMLVGDMLARHRLNPSSITEVGCGAGQVLRALRDLFPLARISGYDIAPAAARYWGWQSGIDIDLTVGDFLKANQEPVDVVLLLDVLEHLGDPWTYLDRLREHAHYVVFHIPLDLSAVSVFRERPLLVVRRQVGHIHYFTRGLALAMLDECGYEVLDARYTGAAFTSPQRSIKTRLAGIVRRVVFALLGDYGVRLLGGQTLLVLARPRATA